MTSGPASRRASVVDDIDAALNGLTSDATTLGRGAPTLQVLSNSLDTGFASQLLHPLQARAF